MPGEPDPPSDETIQTPPSGSSVPAERPAQRTDVTQTTGGFGHGASPSPAASPSPSGRPASRSGAGSSASATRPFADGETIAARYRVVRFIAHGGMGEVYEVEDLELHERLALKRIRPQLLEDPLAVERFKREIKIARQISHPNVCRIHELWTHRPEPETEILFLTMELLQGETLADRIRRGPLPRAEIGTIVGQIAGALDAAHGRGVIHRDFKSANVMLVPEPAPRPVRVVVTDFGLARGLPGSDAALTSISGSGAVVGTPAYMAPEQVEGKPLTSAADIYALGIVIYEMATGGVRPFAGASPLSVAVKRLLEPPQTPRVFAPDIDPGLESVILRCLERDPAARFPSAGAVARALSDEGVARTIDSLSAVSVPAGRPAAAAPTPAAAFPLWRRKPLVAGVAAGALVLAVVGGILWGRATRRDRETVKPTSGASAAPVVLRKAVAVLDLGSAAAQPSAAWLSTAVPQAVAAQLGGGGQLRVVPDYKVAEAVRGLSIANPAKPSEREIKALLGALGADYLVAGSYSQFGAGAGSLVRVEVGLFDGRAAAALVIASATGTEAQVMALASRLASQLRLKLGLPEVAVADAVAAEASLPKDSRAAALFAQAQARLHQSDAAGALPLLEKAIEAEPSHPLPHYTLAIVLARLGFEVRARDEAQKALGLAERLPPQLKMPIEAGAFEFAGDWAKAVTAWSALRQIFPDDVETGLRLAKAQVFAGQPKEALLTIDALRRLPAPASDDPRIDMSEADTRYQLAEYEPQRDAARRAAGKARALGEKALLAQARVHEAQALIAMADVKGARAAAEEARSLFDTLGDRGGVAAALELLAMVVRWEGDLDGARRLYERALEIDRTLEDGEGVARVELSLGSVLLDQGRPAEAEKLHAQALATFDRLGDEFGKAAALGGIGVRLLDGGDLPGAEKRFTEALNILTAIDKPEQAALMLSNLGEVYLERGQLDHSAELHQQAVAMALETGSKLSEAYDTYRLGRVALARGDLIVAKRRLSDALAMQEAIPMRADAAATRAVLGAVALENGEAAEAEKLAREAEEVLAGEGSARERAEASLVRARALVALGRPAEALTAIAAAEEQATSGGDVRLRIAVDVTKALTLIAQSPPQRDKALALAKAASASAAKKELVGRELEARLVQLQIEKALGQKGVDERLKKLAADASAKGYGLIARRASAP